MKLWEWSIEKIETLVAELKIITNFGEMNNTFPEVSKNFNWNHPLIFSVKLDENLWNYVITLKLFLKKNSRQFRWKILTEGLNWNFLKIQGGKLSILKLLGLNWKTLETSGGAKWIFSLKIWALLFHYWHYINY